MFSSKSEDDPDLKGLGYIIVTVTVWRFMCFNWTQKTVKGIRKVKEGEENLFSSIPI
jgi:hypothetical protein